MSPVSLSHRKCSSVSWKNVRPRTVKNHVIRQKSKTNLCFGFIIKDENFREKKIVKVVDSDKIHFEKYRETWGKAGTLMFKDL